MLAPPHSLHLLLVRFAVRCSPLRTPCTCSFAACARRCQTRRTHCTGSVAGCSCPCHRSQRQDSLRAGVFARDLLALAASTTFPCFGSARSRPFASPLLSRLSFDHSSGQKDAEGPRAQRTDRQDTRQTARMYTLVALAYLISCCGAVLAHGSTPSPPPVSRSGGYKAGDRQVVLLAMSAGSVAAFVCIMVVVVARCSKPTMQKPPEPNERDAAASARCAQGTVLEQTMDSDVNTCQMCLERPRNVLLLPCR